MKYLLTRQIFLIIIVWNCNIQITTAVAFKNISINDRKKREKWKSKLNDIIFL